MVRGQAVCPRTCGERGPMGFECGSLGTTPTVSVCPPLQRSSGQQVPSWPALVVCPSGLAPGGSHQRGGGLLHYAVWTALWKGQLSPVAHLHGCVLCGECVHHPAPEGQSTPLQTGGPCPFYLYPMGSVPSQA